METDAVTLLLKLDDFLLARLTAAANFDNFRQLWRMYAVYSSGVHVILADLPNTKLKKQVDAVKSIVSALDQINNIINDPDITRAIKFFSELSKLDPKLLSDISEGAKRQRGDGNKNRKEVTGSAGDEQKRTNILIGGNEYVGGGSKGMKKIREELGDAESAADGFDLLSNVLSEGNTYLSKLCAYVGDTAGAPAEDFAAYLSKLSSSMDKLDEFDTTKVTKVMAVYILAIPGRNKDEMLDDAKQFSSVGEAESRRNCKKRIRDAAAKLKVELGKDAPKKKVVAELVQTINENIHYIVSTDIKATCILKTIAHLKAMIAAAVYEKMSGKSVPGVPKAAGKDLDKLVKSVVV